MPYFVYILECSDKSLYIGYTNNLEKRLHHHNHSKSGAHYTKIRRPVVLKYSEKFRTLSKALKRECEIKKLTREEKLGLFSQLND
ncbi:MAG: GIY-YIG nuclease family protein [Candidatus Paceibacterota bacterium]|jgi:putative endonuclease